MALIPGEQPGRLAGGEIEITRNSAIEHNRRKEQFDHPNHWASVETARLGCEREPRAARRRATSASSGGPTTSLSASNCLSRRQTLPTAPL